jgi:hypothetical protein
MKMHHTEEQLLRLEDLYQDWQKAREEFAATLPDNAAERAEYLTTVAEQTGYAILRRQAKRWRTVVRRLTAQNRSLDGQRSPGPVYAPWTAYGLAELDSVDRDHTEAEEAFLAIAPQGQSELSAYLYTLHRRLGYEFAGVMQVRLEVRMRREAARAKR